MNWDRIEGNWKQSKSSLIEQWDDLTEDQLASRIEETYESTDNDAGGQLTDWQQRQSEIEIERGRDDAWHASERPLEAIVDAGTAAEAVGDRLAPVSTRRSK